MRIFANEIHLVGRSPFQRGLLESSSMRLHQIASFALITVSNLLGQFDPAGTESLLYVPTLTVSATGAVATSSILTFHNPNPRSSARIAVFFFGNDGQPWPVDLGGGLTTEGVFEVPVSGRRTFTATRSSRTNSGWLMMYSTVPVTLTVTLQQSAGGKVVNSTVYAGGLPSFRYHAPASENQEFCVCNPREQMVTLTVAAADTNGIQLRSAEVIVRPMQRTCFRPRVLMPALAAGFTGSVLIVGRSVPPAVFVVEHHSIDGSGYWSLAPPAAPLWPIAHEERTLSTFNRLWAVAATIPEFPGRDRAPNLQILRNRNINAYASQGESIAIELGLSQLISDSPSELAAVIGHELGHIYQQRGGGLAFDSRPEYDADLWGVLLSIGAGFDPYGISGALAKLSMASGRSGLITQFEDQLSGEAHGSFNERLSNVFEMLRLACSMPSVRESCASYKDSVHPNLPDPAPLNLPGPQPFPSSLGSTRPRTPTFEMDSFAKEF